MGTKRTYTPLFSCENFKVLKVIGEEVVQVVTSSVDQVDLPAGVQGIQEIIAIDFELINVTDRIFTDKIVKQGTIRKRVQFCDTNGVNRCEFFDIPFTTTAEITGVDPELELEIQNELVLAETDFNLIDPQTIEEQLVFEIKITVSTWTQQRLRICNTNIISYNIITN
ncbi:DUF3794 domain-containing protein [Selenihalanaerobacter shriftii]|uniref:SipL SPOCS domain-containing protein n=1 Tax=Selenihalanaerobacter shriftii TaxID=142842 RepID=A0A1T4K802_9FIRM|nr:DUF3794 domain-containing protein [Selenihalanaerobacter shriftii]SJZ38578.1 protein of unknown function [Selenihalanaerobacter shriftii]